MARGAEGSAHALCLGNWDGCGDALNSSASCPCQLRHDTRTKGTFYRWEIIGATYFKGLGSQGSSLIDDSIVNGDLLPGPF